MAALRPFLTLASTSRTPLTRASASSSKSTLSRCNCLPPVLARFSPLPRSTLSPSFSRYLNTSVRTPNGPVGLLAKFPRSRAISGTATLPASTDVAATPLTSPQVATYLLVIAGMVFSIVVVGGLTRLTESGLSITEWNVVSGIMPPLGEADWESEFSKYRASPEWRL